ncbi:ADP-glyceromanno-heptose 6-epimerase [Acidithiobacillus sp.]|uniref:ADP-glyceromanno-heptose 6-epimerase n=1 Tax=Acidithiobacillus sp. TaxID=1872118 RepID=UPI00258A3665|nr:ADP-glyceromanno-heptose 6-epimerase [Acidithiobacillus sp.]MDD5375557.1 ADP-glyceromanno-heptose 6-epimerase [Acidithiobacillus sp.]
MSNRIIITGAAGFIGSNIAHALNARGYTDILAVDDLTEEGQFHNLTDLQISDYIDKRDFYHQFAAGSFGRVEAIFHEGACSDTMEHNGRYVMDNNYRTSKTLLDACLSQGTRLLYASSAATYGASDTFVEDPQWEKPLNVYGYSKLLFDQVVRQYSSLQALQTQVAGFRYFNVYGPGEQHKGRMASVAFHHFNQFLETGKVKLFGAYGGYGPGEHERDFIWIDDLVAVKLWFFDNPIKSGIFNLGSGRSQPFNDIAHTVVNVLREHSGKSALSLSDMVDQGLVEYIDFPQALVGKYQCHTQADLTRLRTESCDHDFADVATGTRLYIERLLTQGD